MSQHTDFIARRTVFDSDTRHTGEETRQRALTITREAVAVRWKLHVHAHTSAVVVNTQRPRDLSRVSRLFGWWQLIEIEIN